MIRNKERLRRAPRAENAVNDENFLIAKIQDSESTTTPRGARKRLTRTSFAHDAHHVRVAESASALGFPAFLTITDVGRNGVFCIPFSKHRAVFANHAARLRDFLRQHFLKRDTVFFCLLVYSE